MKVAKVPFFAVLAVLFIISACNSNQQVLMSFGEPVDSSKAIPVTKLIILMGDKAQMETTISGKVANVCKAEGCWLKLESGENEPLMVRMKDHAFTVTEDVEGKFAFITGQAHYDTLTVEKLRDYAKDEGAGPDEIAAIIKPELDLVFEAKGVAVR